MKQVDIKGFENYQITDDGRVWSKKKNVFLKSSSNKYKHVILCKNGITYSKTIHRLVAEAFIPNPENKPCVDHINGNKQDNRVTNLRWATHKENCNNPITKNNLVNVQINLRAKSKTILQYNLNGELVKEWPSMSECNRNGFNKGNVYSCCKGLYKQYNGYIWRYKG